MADTQAMAMQTEMDELAKARMSVTEAMDVLDEFKIKRGDMQRVHMALGTMIEPEETSVAVLEPEADDSQMMSDVYARKPKAA